MKKIPFKIQLVAVLFVLGAAFLGFQAQVRSAADSKSESAAPPAFRMAVVDVQALLNDSDAAKNIQEQLKVQRDQFQKEVSEQETKLKEQEKSLIAANGKVSEAEFNKKKAALEKGGIEAQQMIQKRKNSLEGAAGNALERLRMEITKVVAELSDKEKYDIVITRQNVVLAVKSLDITEEVMKRLNDRVSKIELKVQTN